MADGEGKVRLDGAIQLVFNDASKTISDLKSREWQATNLAILGIVGIVTFSQNHSSTKSKLRLSGFIVSIVVAYFLLMWRCESNLDEFRARLKSIRDLFPAKAQDLFGIVDEGTIVFIACALVAIASVFAILDIWRLIG